MKDQYAQTDSSGGASNAENGKHEMEVQVPNEDTLSNKSSSRQLSPILRVQ